MVDWAYSLFVYRIFIHVQTDTYGVHVFAVVVTSDTVTATLQTFHTIKHRVDR